ncbi:P-loop containing nucleoside triphosphate hydrolase protein [Lentinula lateritia]|uniref:P-loop containing nucleoside triphosphate hydrolase protein n=1 Tax=Lentinula lateritia TaxID=40482 RepID=A0ABQ8VA33_9AGAR|nr:P-loop containing nucleoside triphosphate hydrolase protein [Lentinula lateritia]
MAKKKKTQLKPVARGFATISVPKKVAEVESEDPLSQPPLDDQESAEALLTENSNGSKEQQNVQDEFDLDKVEEQSLQNLVDRYQEKTEKEIVRNVKAIEVDRRFSKTLPSIELDSSIIDRVLDFAKELQVNEGKKTLEESEEKAVTKLAITYGVLRRLGFTEERVTECLTDINGVDLEEAYDWLFINCQEDELSNPNGNQEELRLPTAPNTPKGSMARTPRTPRTPAEFLIPSTPTPASKYFKKKPSSNLDANAPVFIPSWKSTVDNELTSDSASALHASPLPVFSLEADEDQSDISVVKSRILASFRNGSGSDTDSSSENDLNDEYVRLKLKIASLSTHRDVSTSLQLQELQNRLSILQKNYFFNEREAEKLYAVARKKADIASLDARLRGVMADADITNTSKSPKKRPVEIQTSTPEISTTVDVFDLEDGAEGGVLDILEEMPNSEITTEGVTVSVRDMALPKHWSGRTSKILLGETVAKSDRYAVVTYSIISGSSRVKRASVSVRWEGRKTDEWFMVDVACHDEGQAEQYVATLALHALTFPSTEGFAAGSSGGPQTFFRLLPPVYRDLWSELTDARKLKDDAINRGVWANLRSIVEPKLSVSSKDQGSIKIQHATNENLEVASNRRLYPNGQAFSEQLMSNFLARQSTSAYQEMLVHRNALPIASYRDIIIDTLEQSQVLVLSGETGCGKSTQLPTFILEDQLSRGKPCKIYCTEPRRISAISLAQRVSRELGEGLNAAGTISSLVGYSIRLESNTTKNTRLAFVTNGIALRMLEGGSGQGGQGTAFDEITHIIIDEVHERSIESDFLLIVLKSLLEQRSDLKVVLMSATVDAEKISEYFGGCPMLHVPGRTYPVDVRYLEDAVEYTQWSISENSPYARRVHDKFYRTKNKTEWAEELAINDDEDSDIPSENVKLEKRYSPNTAATINLFDERLIPYELILRLLEKICFEDQSLSNCSAAILIFMPGLGEIRKLNDILTEHSFFGLDDFKIYPLHSTLSSESQSAVFDIPPPGVRKIVIATNIAETGITIPDITCVIDTGKHREMRFDEKRQISRLVETFIARSNAAQRRGRAGRVQEGLCFHLFTKVRHDNQMVDNPLPEMMRLSLADLSLRIKIMKVKLGSSIEDVLSRALDPPTPVNVQRAISMLVEVRALTSSEEITPMGRLLSKLPTDVHLGKFLLIATLFRCLDPALTIAAALNSKSPFLTPFGLEQEADRAKASFKSDNSDFLTLHNVFSSWRKAGANANPAFVRKFCKQNFLSHQNLQQIEELRQQFLGYLIDASFIQVDKSFIRDLNRARYSRNRTRFVPVPPELDSSSSNITLVNAALLAGLYPKVLAVDVFKGQMRTLSNNQQASFHPSSVNFGKKPTDLGTNHIAYFTLMHSKKLYAWETGPVDDMAMLLLCGEVDFKLISNAAFIDRKVKFQIAPKTNIALKFLRTQLTSLLWYQFRGKILTESQILWNELALMVLGKVKIEDLHAPSITISL